MSNSNYEWEDQKEKEMVMQQLCTTNILSSRQNFENRVLGKDIDDDDKRYLVWPVPVSASFDPKNEDGAKGPLEAIQMALELHVDDGWDWLVWDTKQNVGFGIESNTYIYAPVARHYQKHSGPPGFRDRSSQYLREVIDAASAVLKERGEL